MRLILIILLITGWINAEAQIINTFPYLENFEANAGNWAPDDNSIWQRGTPNKTNINGAFSGDFAFVTGLSGNYPSNRIVSLNSPLFNFASLGNVAPYLRFKYFINTEACCDKLYLEYSLDDQNWISIGEDDTLGQNLYNDTTVNFWSGNSETWKIASVRLSELPLSQNLRLRFRFVSDFNKTADGVAIDDVEIVGQFTDVEMEELLSPVKTACNYSTAESFEIRLKNYGQSDISQASLKVMDPASNISTTTINNLIAGEFRDYTANTSYNLNADSVYNFKVWIEVPGDDDFLNDTLNLILENGSEINQFPYVEDFSAMGEPWVSDGINSTWELGIPRKVEIRRSYSDSMAWVTGNLGFGLYNNNENSFVLSPCFNTNGLTNPQIRLAVYWESESEYDGANIQYTTDEGLSWTNLNSSNAINWYNKNQVDGLTFTGDQNGWSGNSTFNDGSKGYKIATIRDSNLSGKSSLRFRVNFGSDINTRDEGFAFDDFSVAESENEDLAIVGYKSNNLDVCQNDNASVWVYFQNFGTQSISGFPVSFLFGNNQMSFNYSGTLGVAQIDSVLFNNLPTSDTGSFELVLYTGHIADTYRFNDTIRTSINIYPDKEAAISNDIQICDTSRALLVAEGNGLIKWYNDSNYSNLVFVGDTFLTGFITTDTTFYFSNSAGVYDTLEPGIRGIGDGSYSNIEAEVYLDIIEYSTIAKSTVFAQGSGSFEIEIYDRENGLLLDSREFQINSSGRKIISPGFDLHPGEYILKFTNFNNVLLYRNTSGAAYDEYFNDHMAILGNNFDPEFYYYLYNMIVVNSEPCPAEASVQVTRANAAPVANYSYTIQKNVLKLFNTSQSGRSFNWIIENLTDNTIDSTSVINPELYLELGQHKVSLIARNDCGTDTFSREFSVDELSTIEIKNNTKETEIVFYPNPANSEINWKIESNNLSSYKACLYDLNGKQIQCLNSTQKKDSIRLKDLENGIYILKLVSVRFIETRKFIKN